ncbi:MAG: DNA gyrase inhibitor YacG [Rhizomicrobium sp.]
MSPSKAEPARRKCPVCRRAPDAKFRPFCSKRCADIDLSRWLDGRYAIPAEEQEPPQDSSGGQEVDKS